MTQPLWKIVWQSLRKQINKKLNTHLLYNPAITLLGIYPREMQTSVHTKTCTWLFVAVLYVRGENWKLTKISNTRWMFKQKPCTSITRILLSYLKKGQASDISNWGGSQGYCTGGKKPMINWRTVWFHLHNMLEMTVHLSVIPAVHLQDFHIYVSLLSVTSRGQCPLWTEEQLSGVKDGADRRWVWLRSDSIGRSLWWW